MLTCPNTDTACACVLMKCPAQSRCSKCQLLERTSPAFHSLEKCLLTLSPSLLPTSTLEGPLHSRATQATKGKRRAPDPELLILLFLLESRKGRFQADVAKRGEQISMPRMIRREPGDLAEGWQTISFYVPAPIFSSSCWLQEPGGPWGCSVGECAMID